MYLTLGRNPTIELLRSDVACNKLLLEESIKEDGKIAEIIAQARKKNIKLEFTSRKQLDKIGGKEPHQGVIAYAESFSPVLGSPTAKDKEMIVFIRESVYEHNVGAIIRSAECLGVSGVILPSDLVVSSALSRSAMGANFHIPTKKGSLFNTIKEYKNAGYQVMAIEISGKKNITEIDYTIPTLLIVGGEDRSISKPVIENIDELCVITQYGKVNSLNMSVAASIVMFERSRQLTI